MMLTIERSPAAKSPAQPKDGSSLSSTESRRGQWRCLVGGLARIILVRRPGGADVLRAGLLEDVPGPGDVANIIGVNREKNVAFLDFAFVLSGFEFRQIQRDQTARDSADNGTENNSAQDGHERPGGNERAYSRNGQWANSGDPAQYAADGRASRSAGSLSVLLMRGILGVIHIWEQHGDVFVGEALGFQVINNSISLVARSGDAEYRIF